MIDRRRFLGIPYERANCLALALQIQSSLGHDIPDIQGLDPTDPLVPEEWWMHWTPVEFDDVQEGTVLVVRGNPLGVGTILNHREVLTTIPTRGSHVQDLRTFRLGGVVGAWRPV